MLKTLNMRRSKAIYINDKQRELLMARQLTRLFLGGRGSGKSHTIGLSTRAKAGAMPRAKIGLASTTYNQILTKTLPAILACWDSLGLREHEGPEKPGHFVIGRKPPKHFDTPFSPPRKFANCITFRNGFTIEMISMDRPDLARGGSYDGFEVDEAALIKESDYTRIILPSIRGNTHRFKHTHWHQNINFYTSIPWKPSGYWIFDFEEKAKLHPDEYLVVEATAYDNIHILTEAGIERMEREMGYLEFQIEVLNKRIVKVPDGFYHKLDEDKHLYRPAYDYQDTDRGIVTKSAKDIKVDELLDLSFDFSGWFNCVTIWQQQGQVEKCVDALHVKGDDKLNELVDKFHKRYGQHGFKFVRLWGEPRGHDKQATGPSIYETLRKLFEAKGWMVEIRAHAGRTTNHLERHHAINDLLAETFPGLPKIRFNEENCKDVIIAMQTTEITPDFRKNKSKEKLRDFPQEHAPHYTDTVDYYLMDKHGWQLEDSSNARPGQALFM